MLMAALIVFGAISFLRLGISQLPDVDFPVVSVSMSLNGAAPEVIESQVLDPIEDSIMQIDGIRSITSSAQQSSGSIAVEFELNQDIDAAMQEIQNHINQVANLLPTNLFPPTVRKSNPEDQPILWLALTSDDPNTKPIDMMMYSRDYLYDIFSTIPGVGNVALGGYVSPALRVWTDLNKLEHYNLTAQDVIQAIQQEHIETPAGFVSGKHTEYNLRTIGEATSPEEFGKIMVNNRISQGPNYRPLQLKQVAVVEEGIADIRKLSRFNKLRSVGLGILKQHGSNAVEVANLVRDKLAEIQPLIPKPYHVDLRSDNTRFIKQSVNQLLFTLMLSALLTSVVCYLFLGSWTSTLNVLMAIPTSIVGTFIVFYFCNFTLNTFTLLGLSLAIGIVVDDAIMMLENIVRHRELGEKKREAALKGSKEITFAAIAATIAVVAIFLPVVFMQGVIGRYFLQYGITVTAAVLLSLLEALTLTPMRCSRFLTVNPHPTGITGFIEHGFKKMSNLYTDSLRILLAHRWKTLMVTLGIFLGSLLLAKHLPSEMMPSQDQSMILLRFKLAVGTAIGVTDSKIKQVEDYLLKQPEVTGVFSAVGGFGGDAVNQGNAFVTLVDKDKRKATQTELVNKFRSELNVLINGKDYHPRGGGGKRGGQGATTAAAAAPETHSPSSLPSVAPVAVASTEGRQHKHEGGNSYAQQPPKKGIGGKSIEKGKMEIVVQDLSLRGFSSSRGFPVEFIIQGPDWEKLTEITSQIMEEMKKSGYVNDVNTDVQDGMPEVQVIPNREKLAQHAVSLNTVTDVINSLVGGAVLTGQTEYSKGNHRYEIELRLIAEQRDKLPDLNRIQLRNNRGEVVKLSDLVDEQIKPSLMLISRLNRARAISVYANPAPGVSQEDALKATEKLAKGMLPPGYFIKMTGSSQSFRESFQSLIIALLLGILVSYMVLASQFNSFIHPVTVLMALPFSFTGAFIGLAVLHQSINMYSLIGFILLMGIVKKNSILLVDFTNQMRDEGMDIHPALIHACPVRLRPIVMTSVATIAGALPEALSLGPGSEAMIPMAVSIIGGVAASTILTLFVVPCVYSLLSNLERPDPLDTKEAKGHGQVSAEPVQA
jgi:HAE1 family hydrophobic/amphiphilic exporter-1